MKRRRYKTKTKRERVKALKKLIKAMDKITKSQSRITEINKEVYLLCVSQNYAFIPVLERELERQENEGAWPGEYEANAVIDACLSLLIAVIKIKHRKEDWDNALKLFFSEYLNRMYSSYWMLRRAEELELL
jgi:hypothetical protein